MRYTKSLYFEDVPSHFSDTPRHDMGGGGKFGNQCLRFFLPPFPHS